MKGRRQNKKNAARIIRSSAIEKLEVKILWRSHCSHCTTKGNNRYSWFLDIKRVYICSFRFASQINTSKCSNKVHFTWKNHTI